MKNKLQLICKMQAKGEPSWSLTIPRILLTNSKVISPIEEWFVTISLQEGIVTFTSEGTLLDLIREPILQWVLGRRLSVNSIRKLIWKTKTIKITKSPCANDVALVGLGNASLGGIFIGMTYSGFWEENDTVWYDLLDSVCAEKSEDCGTISLLEMVLTNFNLVLLTSLGLFVSSDLRQPSKVLKFTRIQFCGFETRDYIAAKLWYTELCLANREEFEEDYVAITFGIRRSLSQEATCFYSSTPLHNWKTCVPYAKDRNRLVKNVELIAVLIDHEMSNALFLSATPRSAMVIARKLVNQIIKPHFQYPGFRFPPDFKNVKGMAFHPGTHFLYAFGNQIWISYDGGNSFEIIARFYNDVIIWSYHSFHTLDIVFVSRNSNLYMTKAGIKSYIKLGKSKINVFGFYFDHVGSEAVVSLSYQTLDAIDIHTTNDNKTFIKTTEDLEFNTALAPQYITSSEMIFFAYVPPNSSERVIRNKSFHPRHIGKQLQLKTQGNAEIVKIMTHKDYVGFLSSATAILKVPFAVETIQKNDLSGYLTIEEHSKPFFKISLHLGNYHIPPQFQKSDIYKTVVIPGFSSFLILEILNSTNVLTLATMPNMVPTNVIISNDQWYMYNFAKTKPSGWSITTSSCKHVIIHDEVNTARSIIKYLDLGASFTFKIKVLSQEANSIRTKKTPLLKIVIGRSALFNIATKAYWDETDSYIVEMEILNRYFRKGMTSISFIVWQATVDCLTSAIILKLKSSCSYNKHMSFLPKYQISLDAWERGEYQDEHGFNIIKTLPVNYRPPSTMGLAIPTTDNFYHADPSKPRQRNYHPASKKTGKYKQCLNKRTREDCNCTTEQKLSQNIIFSDCTEKVVRFIYPVIQYPIFLNIKDETTSIPMEPPYLVTISEVNKRKNWKLRQSVTDDIKKMKEYLEIVHPHTVFNPKDLNLSISGSELYHFRVTVIPGVTFCKLITEFQIYVDNAPYSFPGRFLIASITAVILGGIILAVFMVELFDVHFWTLFKHLFRKKEVKESTSSFEIGD
ncbi:cation channel sperm-associated auxiliary subunit beta-like isoform X1 [Macrotis lagotis]|uniref:cation channel sperm-associated auxiliary subunit beta-like isoform X1 n=1 Tax=Macrotis lagotis TaxID=92651 RepID=UPI003D68C4E6